MFHSHDTYLETHLGHSHSWYLSRGMHWGFSLMIPIYGNALGIFTHDTYLGTCIGDFHSWYLSGDTPWSFSLMIPIRRHTQGIYTRDIYLYAHLGDLHSWYLSGGTPWGFTVMIPIWGHSLRIHNSETYHAMDICISWPWATTWFSVRFIIRREIRFCGWSFWLLFLQITMLSSQSHRFMTKIYELRQFMSHMRINLFPLLVKLTILV